MTTWQQYEALREAEDTEGLEALAKRLLEKDGFKEHSLSAQIYSCLGKSEELRRTVQVVRDACYFDVLLAKELWEFTLVCADEDDERKLFREVLERARKESDLSIELEILRRLNDRDEMKETAERLTADGMYEFSLPIYARLKDVNGIRRVISLNPSEDISDLEPVSVELMEQLVPGFRSYITVKGFPEAPAYGNACVKLSASAQNLADRYDVTVPIARSGLYGGYIFGMFGIPSVAARAKIRGRCAEWKWIDSPDELYGKRVLVIDDDFSTGRTLRRCVREIMKYHPSQLGVFFINKTTGFQTVSNIPTAFDHVSYSGEYGQADLLEIYDTIMRQQK
jgi:hypothetical protein